MIMNGKIPMLISGVPNVAALLRDDQVARQREAERPGQHVAVGGADRRLAELADQLEEPREPLRRGMLEHERNVRREAREIAAAREDRLVRRREDDAPHLVVVACGGEGGEQVVEHPVREGVARLRLIERDRRNSRRGDVVANRLVARAHMRKMPYPSSPSGAWAQAASARARTKRVWRGSMTPSSQMRAVEYTARP